MTDKKRIVITGGAGFMGSSFADRLVRIGDYEVVIIDRHDIDKAGIESFVGSYGDKILLDKVIKKGDYVFHLGCSTIPAISESDIAKDLNENIVDTINLLDICREKEVALFVFASSGGTVYGNNEEIPLREEYETSPVNYHGIMKLMIEKYIKLFNFRYNLSYVIMRPANLFGRLADVHRPQGAVDVFLQKALAGQNIEIWGDGEVVRDYIYIDDMVDLMIDIVDKEIKNVVINIGSGTGYSLNQVIKIIEEKTKKNLVVKYALTRGFDVKRNILDISKVKSLFGWEPKDDLTSGLEKILNKLKLL